MRQDPGKPGWPRDFDVLRCWTSGSLDFEHIKRDSLARCCHERHWPCRIPKQISDLHLRTRTKMSATNAPTSATQPTNIASPSTTSIPDTVSPQSGTPQWISLLILVGAMLAVAFLIFMM